MTRNDHSSLVRLIATTVDQHADRGCVELAEQIADRLEAGYWLERTGGAERREVALRPHVWPQPSGVAAESMRCLNCGAAFRGRRAEGPCQPPD